MTDDELLQMLDEFHGQARAIILHKGAPTGAAAANFNLLQFAKNAWTIFQVVWPVLKPMLSGALGLDLATLTPAPDLALPPKTP